MYITNTCTCRNRVVTCVNQERINTSIRIVASESFNRKEPEPGAHTPYNSMSLLEDFKISVCVCVLQQGPFRTEHNLLYQKLWPGTRDNFKFLQRALAKDMFAIWAKKKAYYAVLAQFRPLLVFISNLSKRQQSPCNFSSFPFFLSFFQQKRRNKSKFYPFSFAI